MQIKSITLLVIIFSLFGGSFVIPQSFAVQPNDPLVSASECSGPSHTSTFVASVEVGTGASHWTILNHVVTLDSNFGPWQKNLVPEEDPIQVNNPQFLFDIEETIEVGEGASFTDWHEVIVTPDWIWEEGSTDTSPQGTIIENGNEIFITFEPPLDSGTTLVITKVLQYVGPGSVISDANPLVLTQYPTSVTCDQLVGGKIIPVEFTSLALAGIQNNAIMLFTLLITVGVAGLYYFKIK